MEHAEISVDDLGHLFDKSRVWTSVVGSGCGFGCSYEGDGNFIEIEVWYYFRFSM